MDNRLPTGSVFSPSEAVRLGTPLAEGVLERNGLAFGLDAPLHPVMRTMRAMRRLDPDPVPVELLDKLVEAASWAPSGGNAQAYSWLVITDRAAIESLAPLWAKVFGLYRDTFAHLPSSTMQPDQSERLNRAVEYQAEHFAQTPTLIVACYDTSFQRKSLLAAWRTILGAVVALGWRNALGFLRHAKRFADMNEAASVYPGVQNLLLTARALGLGATITTMHLALEDQFKQTLGIRVTSRPSRWCRSAGHGASSAPCDVDRSKRPSTAIAGRALDGAVREDRATRASAAGAPAQPASQLHDRLDGGRARASCGARRC